jgi:predicted nucleic acid-binding Zn ribbon protein
MSRRVPRPLGMAMADLTRRLAPLTLLAQVQAAWPAAVGEMVAGNAEPVAERNGVLTVQCREAVWMQEIDLMGPDLVARLNAELGREAVQSLRCRATPARRGRES